MPYHRLEIKDLTVSYKRVPAVHHVSLELTCGSCIGLLGPNGAGKTSFFKALVGLVPLETGSVRFHGQSGKVARSEIAYLPQRTMVDWDFPITVRGIVEMGRYQALGWWRKFGETDYLAVARSLEAMELKDLEGRQISALSGGQQQRAFLARALAQEAHVFLLDEPFSGLDKPAQDLLGGTIRRLAEAGNLLVVSHHDLRTVRELFDQVIFINGESWWHLARQTKFSPRPTSRRPFILTFFRELFMNMDWLFEPFRHEFMQRALFGCALLVAFGTQIISNSSRIKEDTALGLLFACSFSLGLV